MSRRGGFPAGPLLLAALVVTPRPAAAQPGAPIATDRPSFTSAPRVVDPRVVQIETGIVAGRDRRDDLTATTLAVPDVLVRMGLHRRLELRVGTTGWIRQDSGRAGREATTSLADTSVALDYQLATQEGAGLDLALIGGTSVPTGGDASSGTVDPFARLVWNRALGGMASLGGTLNWSRPTVPGPAQRERLRTLEASLVLGHGLGGTWSAFWEAVGRHQDLEAGATSWFANAGVLKTLGDDWQADAWVGRGLNDVATDWAGGVGLSFRFRR